MMKLIRYIVCFTISFVTIVSAQVFTKLNNDVGVQDSVSSQGCLWADVNNDGYPDLYITNVHYENNFLYINNGDKSFSKVMSGPIVNDSTFSYGGTWGDYNNDGLIDLFVSTYHTTMNNLYTNLGDITFREDTDLIYQDKLSGSTSGAWADVNNDGYLDLFITNSWPYHINNQLYFNNGNGTFTEDSTSIITLDESSAVIGTFADMDNDNDLDLFVATTYEEKNFLYENIGSGQFVQKDNDPVVTDLVTSIAGSWADYDNDGDLDLFVTNEYSDYLFNNNGDGKFTKITTGHPVIESYFTSGASWGDYDNDGYQDLFVSNLSFDYGNFLYHNNGDGSFTKIENEILTNDSLYGSHGCAWEDYDNDGDLDLYVANGNYSPNFFYENSGNKNNWINIKCKGNISNASAIGTKVRLKAMIWEKEVLQLREISSQTGRCSQNSMRAHFGLGDASIVDTLIIEWPSGIVSIFKDISINQFLTIDEKISLTPEPQLLSAIDVPNDQGGCVTLKWIASSADTNVNSLTHYSVWRALTSKNHQTNLQKNDKI